MALGDWLCFFCKTKGDENENEDDVYSEYDGYDKKINFEKDPSSNNPFSDCLRNLFKMGRN